MVGHDNVFYLLRTLLREGGNRAHGLFQLAFHPVTLLPYQRRLTTSVARRLGGGGHNVSAGPVYMALAALVNCGKVADWDHRPQTDSHTPFELAYLSAFFPPVSAPSSPFDISLTEPRYRFQTPCYQRRQFQRGKGKRTGTKTGRCFPIVCWVNPWME